MPPPKESPIERPAVQPKVSADRFKYMYELQVSPEWQRKREVRMKKQKEREAREAHDRTLDEPKLKTLAIALGIKEPLKDENAVKLAPEEEQAIKTHLRIRKTWSFLKPSWARPRKWKNFRACTRNGKQNMRAIPNCRQR